MHQYDARGYQIKPSDTVLDLGAQIGAFAVYAAKKAYDGKVIAYEPFPESFKILEANKKLNKIKNLAIHNVAVSDSNGKSRLYLSEMNSAAPSLINFQADHKKAKSDVKTISLSEVFTNNKIQKIDLLKMDVEGSEYKILFGAPKSILAKIDKIVMEFHVIRGLKYQPRDICVLLENSGFHIRMLYASPDAGHIYARRKL